MEKEKAIIEVELQNKETKGRKPFRFDHAVALLNYEKANNISAWIVPEDSNYIFKDGQLIQKSGARIDQSTEERAGDQQGETEEDKA